MKHSYLAAFLACSIGFSAVLPAYAGLPVKSIFSSRAEGSGGATALTSIAVWPGYGTNLSLIPTGEVIRKAWLDNPSRIVLDSDGGLTGGGSAQNSGSQVLHLKQIQPLEIPGITKAPSTMLTLIVDGPSGKKIYQFQVIVAKGAPQYHTLSVLPDSKPAAITASDPGVSVEAVRQGLQTAISKGWVRANAQVVPKVQSFIRQVQSGEKANAASRSAGISMALVSRLESLGKQSAVAAKDSSTTPSPLGSKQTEGNRVISSAPPVAQSSSLEKKSEPNPAAPPQVAPTPTPPVASAPSPQPTPVTQPQPTQVTQSQPSPSPAPVAKAEPAPAKQPNEATEYVKKESPRQILSKIQIPLEDGTSVTADKLLDIQSRVWTLKKGAYRKTFGSFLNALVNSDKPPEARLEEALKRTGDAFTLNDARWLAAIAVQKPSSETSSIQGVQP